VPQPLQDTSVLTTDIQPMADPYSTSPSATKTVTPICSLVIRVWNGKLSGIFWMFLLDLCPRMGKPSLTRKDDLIALCMFLCALFIIGLAITGILQLRWDASSPVAHIAAK
jgi:hypothetical protein